MRQDIELLKKNMPTINSSYGALDIVGQTLGRYLDYKKETAMIEHVTEQLRYQTEIVLKKIDVELAMSLDNNKKNLKLEMSRLKSIAKYIKSNSKNEREIIKHIGTLTSQLGDSNIPQSVKESIPQLIAIAHQSLENRLLKSGASIDAMSDFDTKQIKG